MTIATVNPATGETLRRFDALDERAVDERIARAHAAWERWRAVDVAERCRLMRCAAEVLERERDALGRLMTLEMGKPIAAARDEAAKSAKACRYYAEHGAELLRDVVVETEASRSWVRHDPLGPVLAIMPWNFPFWQVFRFAAPALVAGNVGLLKHASNVPQCALAIEGVLRKAGFPAGVFQTLLTGTEVVPRIVADPRVAAVTLTGSTGAGRAVASEAGRAIKKSVLELGGSDPFIVLPSADLGKAVYWAVAARTVNNGQSCIAAKRFIVHEAIAEEFERRFSAAMAALVVGDPMDERTQVGPLATEDQVRTVDRQVRESVAAGARVLTGGKRLPGPGWYYAPTVLADIPAGSPADKEEVFGPVALLHRARDLDDAIRIANGTEFGLGASAWTEDPGEQRVLIERLASGMVYVNAMVASHPALPFGGVKQSGYGRELGALGIKEFVNAKTVWVA
jgi:succinate-semialdehyde dehydrogenase/glutarate-semialdehyde dehydrogenase